LFAARLEDLLAERGWSPAELARQLGALVGKRVEPSMVTRWKNRIKLPSAGYMLLLYRLAGARWYASLASAAIGPVGHVQMSESPVDRSFLRLLVAADPHLGSRLEASGPQCAEVVTIAAREAAQMLVDRVVQVVRQTYAQNEIVDTRSGREVTIAFLEQWALVLRPMDLDVSDMLLFAADLRRLNEEDK
jgi:transcriptional regulator with XRE-family HTH domain